jgi:hypothetical protein
MQGVPWTKAWGLMFLGSFLVFESIAFLNKWRGRDRFEPIALEERISTPTRLQGLIPGHVHAAIELFNHVEHGIFILAALIHSRVVFWAVVDL